MMNYTISLPTIQEHIDRAAKKIIIDELFGVRSLYRIMGHFVDTHAAASAVYFIVYSSYSFI